MEVEVLSLGARPLTLEEVYEVAVNRRHVQLSSIAVEKIQAAYSFLQAQIKTGGTFYGVNTGFGLLSNVKIPSQDLEHLQYNLLRSHSCGTGAALPEPAVRAMLLLRAANLSLGHSGVSLKLVEQILAVLNRGIVPVVPEQGSVGASGDLAPLSHLALVLIGEGRAFFGGRPMSGKEALHAAGLEPIRLGPKEGLALINGTQFMSAIGSLALLKAEHTAHLADIVGALSVEALRGTVAAFEPEIHAIRPHPGQIKVAANMRKLLYQEDGKKTGISLSHADCEKVQDPYSLRCIPQVHGATRDSLVHVRQVLEREINSVTDNPLIFPVEKKILSGGNFHGQAVAMAMDNLAIATAELGSMSEQRLEKLVNPALSGLPAFLTSQGGLNSGFMIIQVAAASIVSENKTLCHPASVDSIPTSADKEDHVSMGAWAARKASTVVDNTHRVLSLEFLAAAQGVDFLRPHKSSEILERVHGLIRQKVPHMETDRAFYEYYDGITEVMDSPEMLRITQGM